ncbi:MAG: hypothetical protein JXQ75_06585 [Phycisphaerae bacterium]|nr:hypothetical protein [Phycisphaerae bacterium]
MTPDVNTAGLPEGRIATYVAPSLPPTAPAPEMPRKVGFLKALLLFWILPKRYGPYLAAGSFRRAFAAHSLSLIASLIVALAASWGPIGATFHSFRSGEIRVQLATWILDLAEQSTRTRWSWLSAVVVTGCVPLAELLLVVLGTAVMPFAAGGDHAFSVWKRSVKNAYWSTTILLPASLLAAAAMRLGFHAGVFDSRLVLSDDVALAIASSACTAAALFIVLLLRALLVGAHRYVGPPDGPAFAPREPRCDDCGYLIVGLPLASRCPECGLLVEDSLPGGRRKPTAWQQDQFRPRGFAELLRLQWAVLRGNRVFRRIPVQRDIAAARHFWWGTWIVVILCLLALLRATATLFPDDADLRLAMGPISMFIAPLPFALQSVAMFVGCLWAQLRYGIRDYRVSAIVCYYASPLMWPFMLVAFISMVLASGSFLQGLTRYRVGPLAGLSLNGAEFVVLVALAVGLVALVFWWLRLLNALRAARYANV